MQIAHLEVKRFMLLKYQLPPNLSKYSSYGNSKKVEWPKLHNKFRRLTYLIDKLDLITSRLYSEATSLKNQKL